MTLVYLLKARISDPSCWPRFWLHPVSFARMSLVWKIMEDSFTLTKEIVLRVALILITDLASTPDAS
jgi:hypothetical protein